MLIEPFEACLPVIRIFAEAGIDSFIGGRLHFGWRKTKIEFLGLLGTGSGSESPNDDDAVASADSVDLATRAGLAGLLALIEEEQVTLLYAQTFEVGAELLDTLFEWIRPAIAPDLELDRPPFDLPAG